MYVICIFFSCRVQPELLDVESLASSSMAVNQQRSPTPRLLKVRTFLLPWSLLTQNKRKYIDYKLTKYSNETRIYEVMISYDTKVPRKPFDRPSTLLRHKSLLTSGAWLNYFQDGGILFAISARISGTISTFS